MRLGRWGKKPNPPLSHPSTNLPHMSAYQDPFDLTDFENDPASYEAIMLALQEALDLEEQYHIAERMQLEEALNASRAMAGIKGPASPGRQSPFDPSLAIAVQEQLAQFDTLHDHVIATRLQSLIDERERYDHEFARELQRMSDSGIDIDHILMAQRRQDERRADELTQLMNSIILSQSPPRRQPTTRQAPLVGQ
jgi:hypothetical protein